MHIQAARLMAPLFLAAGVILSLTSTQAQAQQAVPAALPPSASAASDARPATPAPKADAGENP